MASLFLLRLPLLNSSTSSSAIRFLSNFPIFSSSCKLLPSTKRTIVSRRLSLSFALTESESPRYFDSNPKPLLQELADSFDLPKDYLSQLPRDIRLDLNDAAFDLSNGPVVDECGQELGDVLLNLSRAWESADTSCSLSLARNLSSLGNTLPNNTKSAFGKRLLSAGRRFHSMGQFGQGELQRIAKAMTAAGRYFSAFPDPSSADKQPVKKSRMLKFGDLDVEITANKAIVGAVTGLFFGFLSWQCIQGVQNIPERAAQYANDNVLSPQQSLKGATLTIFYSSTVLSVFTSFGLLFLAWQLNSKEE